MDHSQEEDTAFTLKGPKALPVAEPANFSLSRAQMDRDMKGFMERASRNEDKKTVSTEPAVSPN